MGLDSKEAINTRREIFRVCRHKDAKMVGRYSKQTTEKIITIQEDHILPDDHNTTSNDNEEQPRTRPKESCNDPNQTKNNKKDPPDGGEKHRINIKIQNLPNEYIVDYKNNTENPKYRWPARHIRDKRKLNDNDTTQDNKKCDKTREKSRELTKRSSRYDDLSKAKAENPPQKRKK